MVSSAVESPVYDVKLSSVVPASVTGEDKVRELTNADLAVKLHYIRGLYFFHANTVRGLDIFRLKKPMFPWLDLHYTASGRIRRQADGGGGRPFIKCNDGGVRIVEARCRKTLDEWLGMEERASLDDLLVYDQELGPELGFSPLVFIQFTWFRCGGLSVGLSWAHVLGDPFSASAFLNMWAHVMAGQMPPQPLKMPNPGKFPYPLTAHKPISLKRVDPVGDHWVTTTNDRKMQVLSLQVSAKKLDLLLSGSNPPDKLDYFKILSALMWKSLAKIRGDKKSRVVTLCFNDSCNREDELLSNSQVIGVVEVDFAVEKADLLEVTKSIGERMVDERSLIEDLVGRENGKSDFVLYGTNLTFVNMEDVNVYGLQIQGKKPMFVNYTIGGVGEEGVVLVLPRLENDGEGSTNGRTVTAILPENEIAELKNELKKQGGIF